jgi:hypothetical protein
MNALMLIGIVLVGVIVLAVLGVVMWLVVRKRSPAKGSGPAESETPAAEELVHEAAEAEFQVAEGVGGPHPRPRELDRESRRELLLLDERLHRAFFDQSEMSPEQWARIADELLIVHDRMPVGILVERFEQATDTNVSAPAGTQKSPREVAALLNEQLSAERRLELIGRLEEPLEADVYAPPAADVEG